jgi:xanthine dehydrogenase accessory factor
MFGAERMRVIMSHDILLRALQLGEEDEAFAIVGVMSTEGPTAVKAGNKSIIHPDGRIEGWVGGHCTEDEIVRNSLEAIKDGGIRTLRLSTCQGGMMDVYVEPYPQRRKLLIVGHVPIVGALSKLARTLSFKVIVVDNKRSPNTEGADILIEKASDLDSVRVTAQTYAVIATMGENDQEMAEELVRSPAPYVGIVAGKKRAHEILAFLRAAKVPEEQLVKVKSPAGIYIRAVTAEEIALSILAEIVEFARTGREEVVKMERESSSTKGIPPAGQVSALQSLAEVAVDPVCGMTVQVSAAAFHTHRDGQATYFCSEGCKIDFDNNPSKYAVKRAK